MAAISGTEIAAWWGAIVATVVLVWDVFKWWTSGARVRITCAANSVLVGPSYAEGKRFIAVRVVNIGDIATTIQSLNIGVYGDWFSLKRRRREVLIAVPDPGIVHSTPYVLEPGNEWLGHVMQTKELKELASKGYLMVELSCSHLKQPQRRRIHLPE